MMIDLLWKFDKVKSQAHVEYAALMVGHRCVLNDLSDGPQVVTKSLPSFAEITAMNSVSDGVHAFTNKC